MKRIECKINYKERGVAKKEGLRWNADSKNWYLVGENSEIDAIAYRLRKFSPVVSLIEEEKRAYDKGAVMRRAWEIRKKAAAEIGCRVGVVPMGECMKIAWAEEKEFRYIWIPGQVEIAREYENMNARFDAAREVEECDGGFQAERF